MLGIWVLLFAVAALSGLVGIRLARAVGGDSPWPIEASSGLDGPHDTNTHAAGSPIHTVLTGSDISEAPDLHTVQTDDEEDSPRVGGSAHGANQEPPTSTGGVGSTNTHGGGIGESRGRPRRSSRRSHTWSHAGPQR